MVERDKKYKMIMKVEETVEARREFVRSCYSGNRAEFICATLTEDEFRVIDSTEGLSERDYFNLALVKKLLREKPRIAKEYNHYVPKDLKHYNEQQIPWIQEAHDILKWELGREPTTHEFKEDFDRHANGLRFRIFYCLKFPERVERCR